MKMSRVSLLLSAVVFVSPVMISADDLLNKFEQKVEAVNSELAKDAQQINTNLKEAAQNFNDNAAEMINNTKQAINNIVSSSNTTDTTSTTSTGITPEQKTGIIAAVSTALLAGRNNVLAGLDKIAYYTYVNAALKKLATFEHLKGGRFENNIPAIQEAVVAAALITIGYMAYQAYANQNTEDFDADFDADNN